MKAFLSIAIIALLTLLAVARQGPSWHQLSTKYTFEQYVEDFGRNYDKTTGEYNHRRNLFNKRMTSILAHNADKSHTYKKGVNQFSDWTPEEWSMYNQATLDKQPRNMNVMAVPVNQYNGTGRKPDELPKLIDYRTATNPAVLTGVKNQGHCGSCWAHSAAESVESQFALLTGQLPVLSQQQINSCTKQMFGCGGGSYLYAWEYISQSGGLNEEWLYPYTDFFCKEMNKAGTSVCKNITKEFLPHFSWVPKANVTGMSVVKSNDAAVLMEALLSQGPVSVAVGAGDWSDYEHGIFHNNVSSNISWQIDHAVQAVGYGFDFDLNQNYWIVRNSWGTTWGEDGFIRLARPADEPCGLDQNAQQVVCGTSGVLSSPAFPKVAELKKKNV